MSGRWAGLEIRQPPRQTLYDKFHATKAEHRGEFRDDVEELVARSGLFDTEDLIRLMKVGYKQLSRDQKGEFMRRVLFELKKTENP